MKTKKIIFAVIGLVILIVIAYFVVMMVKQKPSNKVVDMNAPICSVSNLINFANIKPMLPNAGKDVSFNITSTKNVKSFDDKGELTGEVYQLTTGRLVTTSSGADLIKFVIENYSSSNETSKNFDLYSNQFKSDTKNISQDLGVSKAVSIKSSTGSTGQIKFIIKDNLIVSLAPAANINVSAEQVMQIAKAIINDSVKNNCRAISTKDSTT